MKPHPTRGDVVICADLIAPEGYGEIIGGSERATDYDYLKEKVAFALSEIDKTAEIQTKRDGSPEIDKTTKDVELIPMNEKSEDYFKREVEPFVPDYIDVFEENLTGKTLSIKTGAEFPFTRYFYEYQEPKKSEVLINEFKEVSKELADLMRKLIICPHHIQVGHRIEIIIRIGRMGQ